MIPLPVFLNGTRDYVQGTQILARAAEALPEEHLTLHTAAFHRQTVNGVGMLLTPPEDSSRTDVLGTAQFHTSGEERREVTFVELADTAPRKTLPPTCKFTMQPGSQRNSLSADFAVTAISCPEDFLIAVIQTIKGLHQDLPGGVCDVWFSGLRAGNIPVQGTFPVTEGILEINYNRLMIRAGIYQSSQAVVFKDHAGTAMAKAMITFAFKSENPVHVD